MWRKTTPRSVLRQLTIRKKGASNGKEERRFPQSLGKAIALDARRSEKQRDRVAARVNAASIFNSISVSSARGLGCFPGCRESSGFRVSRASVPARVRARTSACVQRRSLVQRLYKSQTSSNVCLAVSALLFVLVYLLVCLLAFVSKRVLSKQH